MHLHVHIVGQCHAPGRVDANYPSLGFLIRKRKLDLPINPARSNQGGVQGLDPVCGHDDLRIPSGVKPIQLVEKLQHSSLNLPLPTTVAVVPLGPHSINLVNENEAGAVLVSNPGWMNTLAILQTDIGMTYLLMQPTSSPEQHS